MAYLCKKEDKMLTIYHNPRCGKSREVLQYIENLHIPYTIVNYLSHPLNKDELKELIKKLNIPALALVRTKENIWKELYAEKKLTPVQIINAMVKHPILIERPVVVNNEKAVIARPLERIAEVI